MASSRQLEYYYLAEETAWGTAVAAEFAYPFDSWEVEVDNELTEADKHVGDIDDQYIDIEMQRLAGRVSFQVWPTLSVANMAKLLKFCGYTRDANENMYSFTMHGSDTASGTILKQTGLVCNTCRITASMDSPKLMFECDMIGKVETADGTAAAPSFPSGSSLAMGDLAVLIDTVAEYNVKEFSIEINNNLVPGPPDSSRNVKWVDGNRRKVSLSMVVRRHKTGLTNANAVDYRNLVRTRDTSLAFVGTFTRAGTSPHTSMTITVPVAVMRNATRTGGVGDVQDISIDAQCRDGGSGSIIIATA